MRSTKSRSRNKSNRNRSSGGSGGNVMNRVFDSSGPEGKVRGTPQQIIEKYNQLARDSHLSDDRVATENFQQHAEHYLRLLGAAQKEMDAKREVQEQENRERQAERDRDRDRDRSNDHSRRQERDSKGHGDLSEAPQPDLIEAGGSDSGLVETPENQSSVPQSSVPQSSAPQSSAPKPRRSRKPRVETPAQNPVQNPVQNEANGALEDNGSAGKPDAPEAAE